MLKRMDLYKKYIHKSECDAAKELLLKEISEGTLIYKYFRGSNRDWKTIIKPEVWLCQARRFNDPFDCAFLVNCKRKEKYNPKTEYDIAVNEMEKQIEQDKASKRLQKSVFISCFSQNSDSILMWSHYGANHMGICVGYDLRELIEKHNCFPVIYSDDMTQATDADIKRPNTLYSGILTKGEVWKYEREWRIIDIDESASGKCGKVMRFVKPKVIYCGCNQERTVEENQKIFQTRYANDGNLCRNEIFHYDEYYADFSKMEKFLKENKMKFYRFELNKSTFRLDKIEIK